MMGADPNVLTSGDVSAIHLAAGVEKYSEQLTHLLLQYGADPNIAYALLIYIYDDPHLQLLGSLS